jgi:hypothetical protein
MVFTLVLMLFMFYNFAGIGMRGLLLFGAFVFVGIFGYTSIMDRKQYAVWIELLRSGCGLALIVGSGDWFGLNAFMPWGSTIVAVYFVLSACGGIYFTFLEDRVIKSNNIALK